LLCSLGYVSLFSYSKLKWGVESSGRSVNYLIIIEKTRTKTWNNWETHNINITQW
jgi:hypothetical protein